MNPVAVRFEELSHPYSDEYPNTTLHAADLGRLPLDSVAGVRAMVLESIGPLQHAANVPFHDSQARRKAILIRTGWDQYWGSPQYGAPGPSMHDGLVFRLIRAQVRILGTDFPLELAARQALIEKDIIVVEQMRRLDSVPKSGFDLYVVPLRIAAATSGVVRAFGEVRSQQ